VTGQPCSWTPEESEVESYEHQDNANIHCQPFPESVSEEHEIYTDDDGYHRHHVKHVSYLSAHLEFTAEVECAREIDVVGIQNLNHVTGTASYGPRRCFATIPSRSRAQTALNSPVPETDFVTTSQTLLSSEARNTPISLIKTSYRSPTPRGGVGAGGTPFILALSFLNVWSIPKLREQEHNYGDNYKDPKKQQSLIDLLQRILKVGHVRSP